MSSLNDNEIQSEKETYNYIKKNKISLNLSNSKPLLLSFFQKQQKNGKNIKEKTIKRLYRFLIINKIIEKDVVNINMTNNCCYLTINNARLFTEKF